MENEPPTEEVIKLKKEKKEDNDIVKGLEEKGYNQQQIHEAMNQADIKSGVEMGSQQPGMQGSMLDGPSEDVPVPTPSPRKEEPQQQAPSFQSSPQMPQFQQQMRQQSPYNYQDIQEIIESVVDEKWQQIVSNVGDISLWKGKTDDDISAIKQEILRFEERLDRLQRSVIGKVDEYNKSISKVNTEIQALEKVFQKIMQPFTSNIKELSRITKDLQGKNPVKTKKTTTTTVPKRKTLSSRPM